MSGRRIAHVLSLLLILAAAAGRAEDAPRLLADINTRFMDPEENDLVQPADFFRVGDRLLFSLADASSQDEGILWSTDGTAAGTEMVSSMICPSPCRFIKPMAALRGIAILRAVSGSDISAVVRLWRTDGTSAGTFPLTEPLVAEYDETLVADSSPAEGILYFVGCRPQEGCEIWRSDGTPAGTGILKDIEPGRDGSEPHGLTAWSGKLYFIATGGGETGLWSTDGTPEGTQLLIEVYEDGYFYYSALMPTPSRLFFTQDEDLWATDGTPEGTRLLHHFKPAECDPGYPRYCPTPDVNFMVRAGDEVYFVIHDEGRPVVWRSDGTESGTRALAELPADLRIVAQLDGRWLLAAGANLWTAGDGFANPAPLACAGGCPSFERSLDPRTTGSPTGPLLFLGKDPAHGSELWVTDGTSAGTRRLTDACPGACDGFYSGGYDSVTLASSPDGKVYFDAHGELWVTDGTPKGTRRVAGQAAAGLGLLGDLAYFGAVTPAGNASELWATDGTLAGTWRVTPLKTVAPGSAPSISPFRDGALIEAYDGGRRQRLWRSDGTPEGTVRVPGFELGRFGFFFGFTQVGELSFFEVYRPLSESAARAEMWRTDGTAQGTRRLVVFGPRYSFDLRTAWNGRLLFSVSGPQGCSYWTSDGTPAGTREALPPIPGVRCPTVVHPLGSRFVFVARVASPEGLVPQVFVSDGTPAGTRQISNLSGARDFLDSEAAEVGGVVFFRINNPSQEAEIWRTDGTPEGTFRVLSPRAPANLFSFRGSLYFTAAVDDFNAARGLFRAELGGAPVLLTSLGPYSAFSYPSFTPAGSRLFFVASDEAHGEELWVSDGTPAGTRLVLDIRPGPGSSSPTDLTAAGERIFFTANDGASGRELWVSDGTAGGTRLVWDLNPGGFSSSPYSLVVSNGHLFFGADDGETGLEPWALRLEP
ncbi:MAG TPA: ELWxxDGT repeat protein [Thermoanaerobaculia bacterium]|jgi:ELWxxDGT repeat protein